MKLEDLRPLTEVRGVLPSGVVSVVDVKWYGSDVVELTYKDASGHLGHELIYRDREPTLEIVTEGRAWSFTADGAKLRLVSEAHRIRLAYLFDPHLAIHTSLVLDPQALGELSVKVEEVEANLRRPAWRNIGRYL